MRQSIKDKFKGKFSSQSIKIIRNLDYKEGAEELHADKIVRTIVCPKHCRDLLFDDIWVMGTDGPIRLEPGEYSVLNKK